MFTVILMRILLQTYSGIFAPQTVQQELYPIQDNVCRDRNHFEPIQVDKKMFYVGAQSMSILRA